MKKIKKTLTVNGLENPLKTTLEKIYKESVKKRKNWKSILMILLIPFLFVFFSEINNDQRYYFLITESLILLLLAIFWLWLSVSPLEHRVTLTLGGIFLTMSGARNVVSFCFFMKNGKISPTIYFSSMSNEVTPFDVKKITDSLQDCDIVLSDGGKRSVTLRHVDTRLIETLKSFFQEFINLEKEEIPEEESFDGDDFMFRSGYNPFNIPLLIPRPVRARDGDNPESS